jgi:hypothetical protein
MQATGELGGALLQLRFDTFFAAWGAVKTPRATKRPGLQVHSRRGEKPQGYEAPWATGHIRALEQRGEAGARGIRQAAARATLIAAYTRGN